MPWLVIEVPEGVRPPETPGCRLVGLFSTPIMAADAILAHCGPRGGGVQSEFDRSCAEERASCGGGVEVWDTGRWLDQFGGRRLDPPHGGPRGPHRGGV